MLSRCLNQKDEHLTQIHLARGTKTLKQIRHMMLERCQEVLRDQAELEALCLSEYPDAKEAYEQEVGCVTWDSRHYKSELNRTFP